MLVVVEEAPCLACLIDDVLVIAEDSIRELVATQICPDVFDTVEFGRIARQADECDVVWHAQAPAAMIASTVKDHHGVGLGINGLADGFKMQVHRSGIGLRHDDGSGNGSIWTGSAEQIGPIVALVARRTGS